MINVMQCKNIVCCVIQKHLPTSCPIHIMSTSWFLVWSQFQRFHSSILSYRSVRSMCVVCVFCFLMKRSFVRLGRVQLFLDFHVDMVWQLRMRHDSLASERTPENHESSSSHLADVTSPFFGNLTMFFGFKYNGRCSDATLARYCSGKKMIVVFWSWPLFLCNSSIVDFSFARNEK